MPRTTRWIDLVRLATTGAVTMSGQQTVDGVVAQHGDRILVKDQLPDELNGVYTCNTQGPWPRAGDFDHSANAVPGRKFYVTEGTLNGGNDFTFIGTTPFVLGTDAPTFLEDISDHDAGDGSDHADVVTNTADIATNTADIATNVTGIASNLAELNLQPKPSDILYRESFFAAAGSPLPGLWTVHDDTPTGAPSTNDYSFGWKLGRYHIGFANPNEQQYLGLYWNDNKNLYIYPGPTTPTRVLVDFGFTFGSGAPHGNDVLIAGVSSDRNNNVDAITNYARVAIKGANLDILREGDDNTTQTSVDTGLDAVSYQAIRVRIDLTTLAATRFWIDVGGGLGFQDGGTVNLGAWTSNTLLQPLFEIQKNSAGQQQLFVDYFCFSVKWD